MIVVEVERSFPQPIERVFQRYVDHEGWSAWAGLGRVRLVREGASERDGVGAVRAFSASPGLREEVIRFEPPSRMEYRVTAGLPVLRDHHGTVTFAPDAGGTRVTWRVTFRSRVPLLGRFVRRFLTGLFEKLLARLERDLGR